ncbi:hypothetical protein SKAU_G00189510 [Synaphobranchus kaupii]|uniref:Uncharacterized protein n=1 Tax=Synaphobranchus kaupii TaxID=118154 RepID=A0A9Q1FDC4_SYNKA|nr:hypothetical protein SKAU_G00189510 [Synaphobranchus kaupii]
MLSSCLKVKVKEQRPSERSCFSPPADTRGTVRRGAEGLYPRRSETERSSVRPSEARGGGGPPRSGLHET